jgi:hypothetical protein
MRRLRPVLVAFGSATVVGAVARWWIPYGEVIGDGYLWWREAGGRLVQDSDICSLAEALCLGSHPRVLLACCASVFWLGVIVLSASLLASERAGAAQ